MRRIRLTKFGACIAVLALLTTACTSDADSDSADIMSSDTIDLDVSTDEADDDGSTGDASTTTAASVSDGESGSSGAAESTETGDGDADPPIRLLVTPTSFGAAELCMTRDDLEAALPDMVVGPYEDQGAHVDTEGVTVTDVDGNVEFYAMAIVGGGPQLSFFYSDNRRYQTGDGVGPGTELAVAASLYGPATLSYNVEGESREYASFIAGPDSISFRTGTGPEAGIYQTDDGYNETEEYDPQALIQAVDIFTPVC